MDLYTFDDRTTNQFRLNLLRLCVNILTGKCEFYENLLFSILLERKAFTYYRCEDCKKFFFAHLDFVFKNGYVIETILVKRKKWNEEKKTETRVHNMVSPGIL